MPKQQRVLVVDDSLDMASTVADGLGDRGYDAVAVASGQEALERLRVEVFDAVVTELRMPRIDGMELLAASRKLDPDRPVIVMTAFSAIDTAVESIRQGATHYLTKPFKQDELAIFLRRALDAVALRREVSTLKTALGGGVSPASEGRDRTAFRGEVLPLRDLERRYAAWALGQTGGHRGQTAEKLGVDLETLREWLGEADGEIGE